MTSSILVTGASGFLGRHLVDALRVLGESVVTHSTGDGDLAATPPRAEGVRHVYHLAAKTYVPESWLRPAEFYRTNVLGTVNVLEYCRSRGASFTLVSSYMYGRPERLPIPEDHPVRAFNPYGHSKLLAEEVAQFYQASFGVRASIVRPFNLYGPGQSEDFLIPTLIRQALSTDCEAITVADLTPKRDYIHVDDVVDLLVRVGVQTAAAGVFNAGTGISTSVWELASMIAELAGTRKPILSRDEIRPNEIADTVADITRAKNQLAWQPRIGLREGLRQLIRSARPTRIDNSAK